MEHFLWVNNQRSAQSKFVTDHFPKILQDFSTIIELGTFTGVFTKWLSENASADCKIITYDINPGYREVGELKNTTFRIADILDPSTIFEINSLISFGERFYFYVTVVIKKQNSNCIQNF
jgi:23S rRNA U2552 (ribose-2'-O)-methylase RlmE/FtsJ